MILFESLKYFSYIYETISHEKTLHELNCLTNHNGFEEIMKIASD